MQKQQAANEQEHTNGKTVGLPPGFDPAADRHKGELALRKLYHDSDRLLVVLYTSPTCGPCRTLKPIFSKVADEFSGKVRCIATVAITFCHWHVIDLGQALAALWFGELGEMVMKVWACHLAASLGGDRRRRGRTDCSGGRHYWHANCSAFQEQGKIAPLAGGEDEEGVQAIDRSSTVAGRTEMQYFS